MPSPSVRELLSAAVAAVEGSERPGQIQMAEAVGAALDSGEHLLVQAGTGTGKSLAYLVPALLHRRPVVISTATLALQAQLIRRDLPRLVEVATRLLDRRPTFAILKGRNNYVCRQRLGAADGPEPDALFDALPTSPLGAEVLRTRQWANATDSGDRDDLVPGVGDRVWAQVSVSSGECLGAAKCPQGLECFAEQARERAAEADIVVTNHALLAIDALESLPLLPDHGAIVIDEAHELVDRVTAVATAELTAASIDRAVRAATGVAEARVVEILGGVADGFAATVAGLHPGPLDPVPPLLAAELGSLREAARAVAVSLATGSSAPGSGSSGSEGVEEQLARRIARAAVEEIVATAARLAAPSEYDVAWLSSDDRRGPALRVAPLSVSGLLRDALFADRTVVLTSATLALGGGFELAARRFGLPAPPAGVEAGGASDVGATGPGEATESVPDGSGPDTAAPLAWQALDVGSPFDYARQGILYVARHLPPPGRDGLAPPVLDELAALIEAAGGRTLGLFSSRRAAEQASAALADRLDFPLLCQGDATLGELVGQFAADPPTCLFGTLSLWQGIDVPGPSCQLVVMDRLPFPRPDDPLASARSRAADAAGGNGFMSVFAAHAALRLAQGAGRLIRNGEDRGVVAVLDPRLASARYGSFLRASLPPFWFTTDRDIAHSALRRVVATATL